jgi:hypothetical protein
MHDRNAKRTRLSAALALGFALLCLILPGTASAAKQRPLYWGAWIGKQLTGSEPPWDMSGVSRFEETAQKGLSLVEFSAPFFDCRVSPCSSYSFPTTPMESIRAYGAIPLFSWGSASTAGGPRAPDFQLSDVLRGVYDSYVREFAEDARSWGHPFFLRFNWEMNGDWFAWGAGVNGNEPGEYIAAWRHVHDIFTSVGATNATWVWCPYARDEALRAYYPGGRYVDWTCIDGFNWGPRSPEPAPWRSFEATFAPAYRYIKQMAPRKPMLIAEVASNGRGRAKATWIRGMFAALRTKFPRVRGLIWFNQVDRGVDWPLETSAAATNAFRKGIRSGAYRPNIYGEFAASPILPPASH